jgi:DNA-binding NtrC family response regulator
MRKILIIDDNKYIKIALSLLVEEYGFMPITASDGDSALKDLKLEKPCLVVLDKKLPDCDGIHLLKQIKAFDPCLPVIMLTAYNDMYYAELAVKSGAYAFITKPFDNDEFIGIINNALEAEAAGQEAGSEIKTTFLQG